MWDLPGPGLEPMSPALAGGFLTTAPPGKSRFPYTELMALAEVQVCRSSESLHTLTPHGLSHQSRLMTAPQKGKSHSRLPVSPTPYFLIPSVPLPLNIPTWLLQEYKKVTLPFRVWCPEDMTSSPRKELPVIVAGCVM